MKNINLESIKKAYRFTVKLIGYFTVLYFINKAVTEVTTKIVYKYICKKDTNSIEE